MEEISPPKNKPKKRGLIACFAWFLVGGILGMNTRLKELRIQKGKTQQEVAEAIGCSPSNYARYERGERGAEYDVLKSFSKYFGVTIDCILCND